MQLYSVQSLFTQHFEVHSKLCAAEAHFQCFFNSAMDLVILMRFFEIRTLEKPGHMKDRGRGIAFNESGVRATI